MGIIVKTSTKTPWHLEREKADWLENLGPQKCQWWKHWVFLLPLIPSMEQGKLATLQHPGCGGGGGGNDFYADAVSSRQRNKEQPGRSGNSLPITAVSGKHHRKTVTPSFLCKGWARRLCLPLMKLQLRHWEISKKAKQKPALSLLWQSADPTQGFSRDHGGARILDLPSNKEKPPSQVPVESVEAWLLHIHMALLRWDSSFCQKSQLK